MTAQNHANKFARALWRRYASAHQVRPVAVKWTEPWKPDAPDLVWTTPTHRFLVFIRGVGRATDLDQVLFSVETTRAMMTVPEVRALYVVRDIDAESLEVMVDEGVFVAELDRRDNWQQWDDGTPA